MNTSTKARGVIMHGGALIVAALAFSVAMLTPAPADARVFVGFGFGFPIGFPGYYPPYPYYPPPPPYYPPPPANYPVPPNSPPPASYQPSSAYAPSGPAASLSITYTKRPGWTNAQGEYCREYRSSERGATRGTRRYGTACRDASGQWRIVN